MKLCLDLFLDPVPPINNGDKSIGEFFAWNFVYFDVSKNSLRSVYQGLLLYFMLIFSPYFLCIFTNSSFALSFHLLFQNWVQINMEFSFLLLQ